MDVCDKKRLVLGFDETNNGFSIPHAPFLIVTGALGYDGRWQGTPPYGSKCNRKFFSKNPPNKEEILHCAREYLKRNKDFLYAVIPKNKKGLSKYERDAFRINYEKALAISLISLEFFSRYSLHHSTPIYIHQIDGLKESLSIENCIRNMLSYAGVSKPNVKVLKTGRKKDTKGVIKQADITGYYIASIKLLLKSEKWPFRDRRVYPQSLDDLMIYRVLEDK